MVAIEHSAALWLASESRVATRNTQR